MVVIFSCLHVDDIIGAAVPEACEFLSKCLPGVTEDCANFLFRPNVTPPM